MNDAIANPVLSNATPPDGSSVLSTGSTPASSAVSNGPNIAAQLKLLEDLEESIRKIEQAKKEWVDIFDSWTQPIFVHDHAFRVVRANLAYARIAGMDIKNVIGRLYWEVFPKHDGPLSSCTKALARVDGWHEEKEAIAADEEFTLASGEVFISHAFTLLDEQGGYRYSVHTMEDITEKRRGAQALLDREEMFRSISVAAQDAILLLDEEGRVGYWNSAASRIFGYSSEEAVGQDAHQLIAPVHYHDAYRKGWQAFCRTGQGPVIGKVLELEALRKDGTQFPIELSVSALQLKGHWHALGIVRDITERKCAADEITRLGRIVDNSINEIYVVDAQSLKFIKANKGACKNLGYSMDELSRLTPLDLSPEMDRKTIEALLAPLSRGEIDQQVFETTARRKDGSLYPVEIHVQFMSAEVPPVFVAVNLDITERRQAEQNLRDSESMLSQAQRIAHLGHWKLDLSKHEFYASEEIFRIFGTDSMESGASYTALLAAVHPDDRERVHHAYLEVAKNKTPCGGIEFRLLMKDGSIKHVRQKCEIRYDDIELAPYALGIVQDITAQYLAQQTILRSNRELKALSRCNWVLVRAKDEMDLIQNMCRVIVEEGGYRLAWIGYAQNDAEKSVRLMAQAGDEGGYLKDIRVSWDDNEWGRGPAGVAIRTGQPAVVQDIETDEHSGPWREAALGRGYRAAVAVPLTRAGQVFGVLNVYAGKSGAFDEAELALLAEVADDVNYGVMSQRLKADHDRVEQALSVRLEQQTVLAEIRGDSLQGIDLGALLDAAVSLMAGALGLDSCSFWEVVPDHRTALLRAAFGVEEDPALPKEIELKDGSAFGIALGQEQPMLVDGAGQEAEYPELTRWRSLGLQSGLIMSVGGMDRPLGVVCQWMKRTHSYSESELQFVVEVAGTLAQVIEVGQAQQELRASEARLRSIIEHEAHGVVVIDSHGVVKFANPIAGQILGRSSEEAIGWNFGNPVIGGETSEIDLARPDGSHVSAEMRVVDSTWEGESACVVSLYDLAPRRKLEQERSDHAARLQEVLVETIRAISTAMEKRDPYTAGHQQRVSLLATAIAREMKLDSNCIEGIRLGSLIHDIGKIYVPAEILSRPGKLSENEYGMIKSHAQVGYDIIKTVNFPWPVAQMVYQHHEWMDGSGYPQGLRGDQIVLEARILAVADVVEAMASHRPYRPALKMEQALEEIEMYKGSRYDPQAVEACVRLIREQGFEIDHADATWRIEKTQTQNAPTQEPGIAHK